MHDIALEDRKEFGASFPLDLKEIVCSPGRLIGPVARICSSIWRY